MYEPSFKQEQPRSLAVPIVLALVLAGAAFLIARHFYPSGQASIAHIHTEILATTTVMRGGATSSAGGARVIAPNEVDHTTYIASTIKVENQLQQPIDLDDFTLTITDPSGAVLAAKALRRQELTESEAMFPKLTPLAGDPLWRDRTIAPGQSAEGTLVFSFSMPQAVWDSRRSADLQVDVYHGHPLTVTIPK